MKYDTLADACHAWVSEFNRIPTSAVDKISVFDDSIHEITPPRVGNYVRVIFDEHASEEGEIVESNTHNERDLYKIKLHSGEMIEKYIDDIEVCNRDGFLPIYGTMWTFADPADIEWANGEYLGPHLQEIADCGFRIYESEDFGILIGIDSCGYSFMEAHWIPLYKARGLHWHKEGAA